MILAPSPAPPPEPPLELPVFPVSDAVAARIRSAAAHRDLSEAEWIEYHFRAYFGIQQLP